MASGCLCISTDAGGPVEILEHGQAGILFEPKSAIDLSVVLESILKTPEKFNHLRIKSLTRAREHYSESKVNFSEVLF